MQLAAATAAKGTKRPTSGGAFCYKIFGNSFAKKGKTYFRFD